LPTAQHKAGLAGLVLQVESMHVRGLPPESIPRVELTAPTTAEATFTELSLRGLFDDLYDARPAQVESPTRWPGATPLAEREKPDPNGGGGKPRRVFVYEVVEPRGHFLRQFTDDGREAWHKLWRNMLWAIPRSRPMTRLPFNNRAEGKTSGEGESAWAELLAAEKARAKGELRTCEVAGAILLGAQAASAESVPFRDRSEHALLLHFWQLTARVLVPEHLADDGGREFVGYVLAVPEVADLRRFCRLYKQSLAKLGTKLSGYRPAEAVISLPAQGALEFMEALGRLAGETASAEHSEVARTLAGVEFFHLVKIGNNVKTASGGRVPARPGLLREYGAIKQTTRNPVFRQARLRGMLQGTSWYVEFATVMAERDWPLFVRSERTPRTIPSFAWDATARFHAMMRNEQTRKADTVSNAPPADRAASLETLIYRLVRTYVRAKTEQKSGVTYASFKDRKVKGPSGRERVDYPRAYTEAQEKVCADLFLGMRSRHDDEFVSYFTGTIGSVAQGRNLSEEDDFRVIATALLDEQGRRDVKTLAMLAVAAASYAPNVRAEDEELTDAKESAR
ncbi:MAG TPA: type I-MYXAN CRISPR-associated protein Cmx8, partial [Actinospica sp.]|nr:type I-MYXAN CRISPR-associated protein Cmx8 [Actinospica sp.]